MNFFKLRTRQLLVPNKSTLYKIYNKNFNTSAGLPLSFKNKINALLKLVHPDVLGKECPSDLRRENEKSVQTLNSYLECLDKGTKFDGQSISFNVSIIHKLKNDELKVDFPKFNMKLDEIKPSNGHLQSNRTALQLK